MLYLALILQCQIPQCHQNCDIRYDGESFKAGFYALFIMCSDFFLNNTLDNVFIAVLLENKTCIGKSEQNHLWGGVFSLFVLR